MFLVFNGCYCCLCCVSCVFVSVACGVIYIYMSVCLSGKTGLVFFVYDVVVVRIVLLLLCSLFLSFVMRLVVLFC